MTANGIAQAGKSEKKKTVPERRTARRYLCCKRCLVHPAAVKGVINWPGIVHNLSTAGMGLTLGYPVLPGTILVVEPWDWNNGQPLTVRVVRSTQVAFAFFHGCEFLEAIGEDEFQRLLR
jgi:hypothetical protein